MSPLQWTKLSSNIQMHLYILLHDQFHGMGVSRGLSQKRHGDAQRKVKIPVSMQSKKEKTRGESESG